MAENEILSGLNPQQREAVITTEGPLLVLAGAGSGKTSVLTRRIAWILFSGLAQRQSILAVTFTNKAAKEMAQRVELLCGPGYFANLGTFHSVCSRWLRQHSEALGLSSQFTIYDSAAQLVVIKAVLKELNLDDKVFPPRTMLSKVSHYKNYDTSLASLLSSANVHDRTMGEIYKLYDSKLRQNSALDFDDILRFAVKMLMDHPEILQKYQELFKYILVDEYQDVNPVQYNLLRLLAGTRHNICAVGDDDQSIYGFRGADISIILRFEDDYPECKIIKLEQNYRSTQEILNAANALVKHNQGRKDKSLWSSQSPGGLPILYGAYDGRSEASFVAQRIEEAVLRGYRYGDIAVLYRANAQSRTFEEVFLNKAIPYELIGGNKFYDRKEIKDVLAHLCLLVNRDDTVSLGRVLGLLPGVGDGSVQKLAVYAARYRIPFYDSLIHWKDAGIKAGIGGSLEATYKWLNEQSFEAVSQRKPVRDLVEEVLSFTHYRARLTEESTTEAQARLENLEELLSVVAEYDTKFTGDGVPLDGFLSEVSLLSDQDSVNEAQDRVTMMTIHTSKGLEYPIVFLTGLEEDCLPHFRSVEKGDDSEGVEEERRLAYVGITRAKQRLFLTYAQTRFVHGNNFSRHVSRFVEEIREECLQSLGNVARHHEEDDEFAIGSGRSGQYGRRWRSNQDCSAKAGPSRQIVGHAANRAAKELARSTSASKAASSGDTNWGLSPRRLEWAKLAAHFPSGKKVLHKVFGEGTVVSVERDLIKVRFASGKERSLQATFLSEAESSTASTPVAKIGSGQAGSPGTVKVGAIVEHPRWGRGVVTGVESTTASVKFPTIKVTMAVKDLAGRTLS